MISTKIFNVDETLMEGVSVYHCVSSHNEKIEISQFLLNSVQSINDKIKDSDCHIEFHLDQFIKVEQSELITFLSMVNPSLPNFQIEISQPTKIWKFQESWDIEVFLIETEFKYFLIYWETEA
jgi:hypothetical protein